MKTIRGIGLFLILIFLQPILAYDLTKSPYLLGDWDGARSSLLQKGITFTIGYGGEAAHNFTGGTRELTEYTDQALLGAAFDFEKLGLWRGGTFALMLTDRNGQNLGADAGIGNDMLLQEVYGRGQTLHLTQFWFNQKFWGEALEWKFGRMLAGQDFASFGCDFQNLSFCGAQAGNIVGSYWLNWPTSVWATRVKLKTSNETWWQLGAYQVNPNYVDDGYAQKYGWTLDNPSGGTGTLIPFEFLWAPTFAGHPGTYKFGVWYNTAKVADLGDPQQFSAQYGAYINFEQQVTGDEAEPGLSVFLNITQADRVTAQIDRQISLGTQYHSPFHRRGDAIGFALANTDNNGGGTESDGELYYNYAPIPSINLRPNVQYVLRPGGTSVNKDALVGGLKTSFIF